MGSGCASAQGTCRRCGAPFGMEPWWVTEYPNGEHTRCRDWTGRPFPFARQLDLMRKLWPGVEGPARTCLHSAGARLAQLQQGWPAGGAGAVLTALETLRALRLALAQAGVDRKVVGKL